MEKIVEVEGKKYKLIKDYRDGFDEEMFKEKYTSFFEEYDYIVGDIAYSKLRLKGFNDKDNKNFNNGRFFFIFSVSRSVRRRFRHAVYGGTYRQVESA